MNGGDLRIAARPGKPLRGLERLLALDCESIRLHVLVGGWELGVGSSAARAPDRDLDALALRDESFFGGLIGHQLEAERAAHALDLGAHLALHALSLALDAQH